MVSISALATPGSCEREKGVSGFLLTRQVWSKFDDGLRSKVGLSPGMCADVRYGLVGRNGVGKSTLLRNLALREVAIPTHISVL